MTSTSRIVQVGKLAARSKGVGTPYLDRDAMLGPLSRKTPKKSYEKTPFLKALELNARSLAIWWDSQWQYEYTNLVLASRR
jgi:hypothetical protein